MDAMALGAAWRRMNVHRASTIMGNLRNKMALLVTGRKIEAGRTSTLVGNVSSAMVAGAVEGK